jgi:hypothetical protein
MLYEVKVLTPSLLRLHFFGFFQRELEREKRKLDREEKKLISEIKKYAKKE